VTEEDGYIFREETVMKRVKIPEGNVRCPRCQGTGKDVRIYRNPGPNEYMSCLKCLGQGYVKREGF
jgi:DnaJ-class molecular chaperone